MLHHFSRFVVFSTLLLIVAGGLVTSTGSGLSVPDWPNTYGWFMFSFPLSKMVGGIYYEHGHRLIASTVGFLTIVLAVWLWISESRRWVRWLGVMALLAVVAQGLLGGLTVLFFLPAPISVAHAGLAQLYFCITVSLALFTSRGWMEAAARPVDDAALRRLAVLTTSIIYVQILLGATMRHTGAGLAIPDFPLAFGHVVPPLDRLANSLVAIHFAHRLGALVVSIMVLTLAIRIWQHHRRERKLLRPMLGMLVLLAAQITLGGLTVLSGKAVPINTAHVVTGAMLLGTSLVIALRAHRALFFASRRTPERDRGRSATPAYQT